MSLMPTAYRETLRPGGSGPVGASWGEEPALGSERFEKLQKTSSSLKQTGNLLLGGGVFACFFFLRVFWILGGFVCLFLSKVEACLCAW